MIIGMVPMALGLGEGAEQNAPLGRAVIGGLLFATVSTLFFVPLVFAAIHTRLARRHRDDGNDGDDGGANHTGSDGNGHDGPAPDHGGAPRPA
jgi:AcrB/AcrD/AcrF family